MFSDSFYIINKATINFLHILFLPLLNYFLWLSSNEQTMESLSMDLFMVLNLEYQTHFSMCQQNFHLNPKNTLSKKGLGVGGEPGQS